MRDTFESFFDEFPAINRSTPAVDVREEDDRYVIEAELPGLKEEDVKVNLSNGTLTISSDKEEKKEDKDRGYIMRERRSFAFRRSFRLPADAKPEDIKAEFTDGVLEIDVPRAPKAKPKRIPIGKK
jgi:HSP20 family molecular chaperone IbpA